MKYLYPLILFISLFQPLQASDSRQLSNQAIEEVKACIKAGPAIFMMRHGEQKQSVWVEELADPALKKIAMMRKEENMKNPLTSASALELQETAHAFQNIIKNSGISSWHIETSKNLRAFQTAAILAKELNLPVCVKEKWTCINYPEKAEMSTEDLLKLLPDGTLPWTIEHVDAVGGPGTYDKIHENVRESIISYQPEQGVIIITHTQQMNAAAQQQGLPVTRVENYGFVLITGTKTRLFSSGLYQ